MKRSIWVIVAFCGIATASGAEPYLVKMDLFQAETEGYKTYRIPGIVVATDDSILAYCEARKTGTGDWEDIDVYLRRSTDGGKTWSPRQLICDSKNNTVNNPVAIVDRSGRIHFMYCIDYARCYYTHSDDHGQTFAASREITDTFEEFRRDYDWNVIATGPGHGIQLNNGRLLVPVWLSTGGKRHRPSAVSTIYSDDHGRTWQRGQIVCNHPTPLVNPSETLAVELSDGKVLLNIRNENRKYRRAVSTSADGASDWSKIRFDETLFEPVCMAALIRLPRPFAANEGTFVFVNPDSQQNKKEFGWRRARENLTVRISADDCRTWSESRVLDPGTSGYSDVAVGRDGTIYCLYERGGDRGFALKYLTLARFNREWISQQ
jgi:sialidase-1